MKAGAQIIVKPPIMIRIPELPGITIDGHKIVYLTGYPIGLISLLCPEGFMECSPSSVTVVRGGRYQVKIVGVVPDELRES